MNKIDDRQIDEKRLYFISAFFVSLGALFLIYNTYVKHLNVTYALKSKGYKNISNLNIYRTQEVFDKKKLTRGKNYHIEFDSNKGHCKGYLRIERRGNVDSELQCTLKD